MVLTTHAITGAAIASVLPQNPALGFAVGFVSHFLLDSIPHWDYNLRSSKEDKQNPLNNDLVLNKYFILDLLKISADGLLGVFFALLLFYDSSIFSSLNFSLLLKSTVFWGIAGSLFPDFLQFVYFKWRHEPLITLQRFHNWIQKEKYLKNHPVIGASLQIILIILVVSVFKFVL